VNILQRKHNEYLKTKQKVQIKKSQTKNKTVFIPDEAHKQNLHPYQHKASAPI
jgi:hypothetical protein